MAATTYSDLQTAVQDLSPSQISTAQAGRSINRAYLATMRLRPWMQLWKTSVFTTAADKTAGTITLTLGSTGIVGVGTAFASTDVGRYLVVGSRQPLRINTFTSTTRLDLVTAWGEATVSAQTYSIISLRYVTPSDCERVMRIRGPLYRLVRRTMTLIDALDPRRMSRGVPTTYAEAEVIAGRLEIELWQVPNSADTFFLEYRPIATELSAAGDVPLIRPDAVKFGAMADQCRMLATRTGERVWVEMGKENDLAYATVLEAMIREDRRLRGAHPVALDSDDGPMDANDPGWVAFYRAINSLSMTTIA